LRTYSLLRWLGSRWSNLKGLTGFYKGRSPLRTPLGVVLVVLVWSLTLGWGLAQASAPSSAAVTTVASLDVIPERFQLGEQLYLRECSSCHIAPSPAVLPTQSWAQILVQPQHYGVQITPLQNPALNLMWNYVQFTSRSGLPNEAVPQRIQDSRFFGALHPEVNVPRPISLADCASCHPQAWNYNYRELSPEWTTTP